MDTLTRPAFAGSLAGRTRRMLPRAEARAVAVDGGAVRFEGHAIVYDEWTSIYDYYGEFMERVARGACTRAIAEDDVRMVFNHDANQPIARHRGADSDTLTLTEDEVGLLCQAEMDGRQSYVRDLSIALERGDVTGMSFSFEALREEWSVRPDGVWMRTITELRLYDVSPVTYPAYEGTDAGLRELSVTERRAVGQLLAELRSGPPPPPATEPDITTEESARAKALIEEGAQFERAFAAMNGLAAR